MDLLLNSQYIFQYIHNIHIYVFHLCFTICILGEMYIQIYIYDKTPKVHRGGGGDPPIKGWVYYIVGVDSKDCFFCPPQYLGT